jgi:hypothetical protein
MLVTAAGMRPAAGLLLGGNVTAGAAEQEDLWFSRHTRFNKESFTQQVGRRRFTDNALLLGRNARAGAAAQADPAGCDIADRQDPTGIDRDECENRSGDALMRRVMIEV